MLCCQNVEDCPFHNNVYAAGSNIAIYCNRNQNESGGPTTSDCDSPEIPRLYSGGQAQIQERSQNRWTRHSATTFMTNCANSCCNGKPEGEQDDLAFSSELELSGAGVVGEVEPFKPGEEV